jgi:hypothetical protein
MDQSLGPFAFALSHGMPATQQMGVRPVHPWKGRRRAAQGLFVLLVLSTLIACTMQSPKKTNREDTLRQHVRLFHWAIIGQDVLIALRYVPSDDREAWEDTFTCLFERLRLLDYRVSLVKFDDDSNKASVRVRWTGHPPDSLVVKEMVWEEEWSFDPKKQRWLLLPSPGELKGLPESCLPREPLDEGLP